MYGKIFASMFDGSLYGNWQAIVTFQQMIILCNQDGVIDMTPQALAARTSIPLEIIQVGIEALESPDRYSRSPDLDGRRIERLDHHRPWGWRIVNYRKYRLLVSAEGKREADRVRIAEKRRKARDELRQSATGCDMSQASEGVADVAQADAEVEVERNASATQSAADDDRFERFWLAYPRKEAKAKARKAFKSLKITDALLHEMLAALAPAKTAEQWMRDGGKFIPHAATWLNGRRWEDEAAPAASAETPSPPAQINPVTGLPNWV